jgi:hypothetical protein
MQRQRHPSRYVTVIKITESDVWDWKVVAEQEEKRRSAITQQDISKNRRKGEVLDH